MEQESSNPVQTPRAPVPFTVDQNSYTLDELEEIETLAGVTMAAIGKDPALVTMRFIRASAYVTARRRNPRLTYEDVGKWTLPDLEAAMEKLGPPA